MENELPEELENSPMQMLEKKGLYPDIPFEPVEKQAWEIWQTLNESERHGVKFGMFPAGKMPAEHVDGLAIALMKMAEKS